MNFHPLTPAAFVANARPPASATAVCPQHAGEEGAPASLFGPPTSHRMEAAGGPFNSYDCRIARYRAAGEHRKADELQAARAQINLAWGVLEPVWIPTQHQRTMLALRADAARDGFSAVAA